MYFLEFFINGEQLKILTNIKEGKIFRHIIIFI